MSKFEFYKNTLLQFIKFCVVGVSNIAITLAVYYVLVWVGCSPYLANTIGYLAGLANAYFWNLRWVFKSSEGKSRRVLFRFLCVYLVSYFLSQGMIYLCVDVFRFGKTVAPLVSMVVTTPVNFLANKYWTFHEKE